MLLTMWLAAAVMTGAPPTFPVRIEAGARDRHNSVVSFPLPGPLRGPDRSRPALRLRGRSGVTWAVQGDHKGRGWFVIPRLSAGTSLDLTLETSSVAEPLVTAQRQGSTVHVRIGAATVLRYQAEGVLPRNEVPPPYLRGGYLHPLFTPSGLVVTDDYPPNHLHHHGVWFSWARTHVQGRTPDFWNMGEGTGKTDFVSLQEATGGPVMALIRARHQHLDLTGGTPRTALEEDFVVQVFRTATRYHLVEIDVENRAPAQEVTLERHLYGGLGVRGHRSWNGAARSWFRTSSGKDRITGNKTRARWVHLGGFVDGRLAGIAVLAHPDNPNAPEPVRCHPQEPFLAFAPVQDRALTVQPARPHRARYRLVIADGPPSEALLDELWADLASPPRVTVVSPP